MTFAAELSNTAWLEGGGGEAMQGVFYGHAALQAHSAG